MHTKYTTKKTAAELSARVKNILTDNTKLAKTPDGSEIINAGVSLAPAARAGVGNVCPWATAGCIVGCVLWFAGRTVTKVVRQAAIARTKLYAYYPATFYNRLNAALVALVKRANKLRARPFCRLNVASDIDHTEVCRRHPSVTFYDYSKSFERCIKYALGMLPQNYSVSYSVNEWTTWQQAYNLHSLGVNLVVVFDSYYFGPRHRYGYLPERVVFRGPNGASFECNVVDGDVHDIRTPEYDGRNKCIALRGKGSKASKLKAISFGFIRHHAEGAEWVVDRHELKGVSVVELL